MCDQQGGGGGERGTSTDVMSPIRTSQRRPGTWGRILPPARSRELRLTCTIYLSGLDRAAPAGARFLVKSLCHKRARGVLASIRTHTSLSSGDLELRVAHAVHRCDGRRDVETDWHERVILLISREFLLLNKQQDQGIAVHFLATRPWCDGGGANGAEKRWKKLQEEEEEGARPCAEICCPKTPGLLRL